jgi:hypothetical protein
MQRISRLAAIIAVIIFSIPFISSTSLAKDTKTSMVKTSIYVSSTVMLGGKELKPGDYQFVADGTSLKVSRDGKLITEATIQWQDGQKAGSSSLVVEGNQIKEIRFGGKSSSAIVQ